MRHRKDDNTDGHAGETRSCLRAKFLLHAPDSFVRTPMPGVNEGLAIVHASDALGAGFLHYTVELAAGGSLGALGLDEEAQRFCYILRGEGTVLFGANTHGLRAGSYVYLPEGHQATISATAALEIAVIEKVYEAGEDDAPGAFVSHVDEVEACALGGDEGVMVKLLLPADSAFDFAVNTMAYVQGSSLSQVEVHVMEHGLVMLEGAGRYRLGEEWFEVREGDVIWMGPYCPQWFAASAEGSATYLIYKNVNRRPAR